MDFYAQQKRNKLKTVGLIFFFILLITFMGYIIDMYIRTEQKISFHFPIFTTIAFGIATVQGFSGYFGGHKLVLKSLRARLADPRNPDEKRAINVVREMSIASGLPPPRLYIINDEDPNALATGRKPEKSYIAVTEGLLTKLNREELQGVIAHEIGHIRNYDILTMTMVAVLAGTVVLLSDWLLRMFIFAPRGRRRGKKNAGGIIIIVALLVRMRK